MANESPSEVTPDVSSVTEEPDYVATERVTVEDAPLANDSFEPDGLIQGLISMEITDTKTFELGAQGVDYLMRSANVKDLDGDGFAEIAVTITTYPGQLPQPIMILGARGEEITDLTQELFPKGVPTVRHSPYIFFPDLNADGRADILFADAGMDEEPYTGSKPGIALQNVDGTFTDVSSQIPEEFWETRSYAIAAGDLDGNGLSEVLLPDQSNGKNTAAITWDNESFTVNRDWIPQELWSGSGQLASHLNLFIEDMDEDGWQDLIVGGNSSSPNLRIAFGGPKGLSAKNILTLPDGIFGHFDWNAWNEGMLSTMQGTEMIGMIVQDFNNDGLKDIFLLQEQDNQYKPGAISDELVPDFQKIHDEGGRFFGQTAFNVFINQGNRKFTDVTAEDTPLLGHRYYLSHVPADLNGDDFLDIVAGYWSKFYANKTEEPLGGTTVFLNDGMGDFRAVEGSALFPTRGIAGVSSQQLGIFVPTYQAADRLEGLFIASESDGKSGTLTVHKAVHEGAVTIPTMYH